MGGSSRDGKNVGDRGIPMHWTTIAKVEKNDRSVRIDEAAGIADLFGTSVDELLGRKVAPERHMTYPLWALIELAPESELQFRLIEATLVEAFCDLSELEFEGREALDADGKRACEALAEARSVLSRISSFELPKVRLSDGVMVFQIVAGDETES